MCPVVHKVYAEFTYALPDSVETLALRDTARNGIGNSQDNLILGHNGVNTLIGNAGNDKLYGYGGSDKLTGNAGNDVLVGGVGADVLFGHSGADSFVFRNVGELSTASGATDRIMDFSVAERDKIHLAVMDADETRSGDQAFTFIGTSAFNAPGQIRWFTSAGETRIIVNTDANPNDYEALIRVSGLQAPDDGWFVL